jgi:MinD superfamily P-loop ATPase
VLIVTQPTELSRSDVKRTGIFFQNRNIEIIGIVENMCYENSIQGEYVWKTLGRIPFANGFNGQLALNENKEIYTQLANSVLNCDEVILENQKRFLFDETITYDQISEDLKNAGKSGEGKRRE